MTSLEQCRREIAAIEASIGSGQPDLQGLCLALADWSAELRLLEGETGHESKGPELAFKMTSGNPR